MHLSAGEVLSASECAAAIAAAEAHAAAEGWGTQRHVAHPTTDLSVGAVPALCWLTEAVETRLLPQLASAFGLSSALECGGLYVEDTFVAKYEKKPGAAGAEQSGLGEHEDGSGTYEDPCCSCECLKRVTAVDPYVIHL